MAAWGFVQTVLAVVAAAMLATTQATPRPTVLWHGMGDTCCNPLSMGAVKREIEKSIPGIYVFSVEVGNSTVGDQLAGFIGNVNDQLDAVAKQIRANPQLAGGFNAVGFSQGGQFLRAYVERYNNPPVYNLVTFGGQHMGVVDIPGCLGVNETLCKLMDELLSMGAYAPGVRDISVQAQYFRSTLDYKDYLTNNIFLADINNERETKNATYKQNFISLNKFVMIMFDADITVVPKLSEFFGSYAIGNFSQLVPYNQQPLYIEDWIGLRTLDTAGKVIFQHTPGAHMQFTMEYLHDYVIVPYLNNSL